MAKYYYKRRSINKKKFTRVLSLLIFLTGISISFYVFFPLISWQIYFAPALANQSIASPIPKTLQVNQTTIGSLIGNVSDNLAGVDYTNAQNWFPNFKYQRTENKTQLYTLTIPKIEIKDALVATNDNDLAKHLVNFAGTGVPPDKGNAVVFGHSTLPQLYNSKDYKTTFTYLYKLENGDDIFVNVGGIIYKYKVFSITVVNPDDMSVLEQSYDNSYLTLITCTPPGTIWKRLIIKARFEKI